MTQSKSTFSNPTTPFHIHQYELTQKIGEGATSDVYFGYDQKDQKAVAIKILKERFHEDFHIRKAFLKQGAILEKHQITSFASVYETGESSWGPWWSMEWVKGMNLKKVLQQGAHWNGHGIITLALQCCAALKDLHQQQLIHGDLKPDNLIYTGEIRDPQNARLTLIDLSLSSHQKIIPLDHQSASAFGTPPYMSPEQIKGETLTPCSDLYSLGVLLYELTTGILPFSGTVPGMIADTLNTPPTPPSVYQTPWPYSVALEALILNLLSKNPQARCQNTQEVIDILQRDLHKLNPDDQPLQHDLSITQTGPMPVLKDSLLELEKEQLSVPKPPHIQSAAKVKDSDQFAKLSKDKYVSQTNHIPAVRVSRERPIWIDQIMWMLTGAFVTLIILWVLK